MKRRLLSAFLAVMMVLTMAPVAFAADTSVDSYDSLVEAINSASDGDTITLNGDIDVQQTLVVTKKLTLKGKKATANLKLIKPSTITGTVVNSKGKVMLAGYAPVAATGWGEVVVKPAVSIGAIGALRAEALDPACLEHLDRLVAEGDVMVQPFVASVAEAGEVSLVYFGGRFSHAIRKQPAPGDFRVQDMYGGTVHPHQPTAAELAVADAVLARTPAPTTYARIDLVEFDGAPALMEAELIEPELFLGATPEAAMNFARVLAGMV